MTKIIKKLVIGTAQFYNRYGLSQKKISEKNAKELIKFLKKKKTFIF